MPDTLPDLDTSKAMVYKTPNGWVAHCSCGPTMFASWADAIYQANLRTAFHRNPDIVGRTILAIAFGIR